MLFAIHTQKGRCKRMMQFKVEKLFGRFFLGCFGSSLDQGLLNQSRSFAGQSFAGRSLAAGRNAFGGAVQSCPRSQLFNCGIPVLQAGVGRAAVVLPNEISSFANCIFV